MGQMCCKMLKQQVRVYFDCCVFCASEKDHNSRVKVCFQILRKRLGRQITFMWIDLHGLTCTNNEKRVNVDFIVNVRNAGKEAHLFHSPFKNHRSVRHIKMLENPNPKGLCSNSLSWVSLFNDSL